MRQGFVVFFVIMVAACTLRSEVPNRAEKEVSQRMGTDAIWERNDAARNESATLVTKLLAKPLTVSSAVQIALLNNRDLQATFETIGIAQADLLAAVTVPNPSVDFDVQYPTTVGTLNRYGWLVVEDFVQLLMIPLKKRISEETLEASELRVADEILNVISDVKKTYFMVQADQQLLAKLKIIQETTATSLDLSQKQYKAGNITDLALFRMQASYNEGRLQVAEAESDLDEQRENLNELLGLWGSQTDWTITDELSPVPSKNLSYESLESLAVSQRLDLQADYREMRSLASAYGLTKTFRWVPVLDLGFTGERDIDGALNLGPAFRLELPIFNQGQYRMAKREAELRSSADKFEALAVTIRSEVRKYRDKLASLSMRATFYHDEVLPTRLQIVNESLLEYNAMQLSPYDLFLAKADELRAERYYIDTLRDFWITQASLERAVGGTLTPRKEPVASLKSDPNNHEK